MNKIAASVIAIASLGTFAYAWAETTSLFTDTFTCAERKWQDMKSDVGIITCQDDHALVRIHESTYLNTYLNNKIANVALEVDLEKQNGKEDTSGGLTCRQKGDSFYALLYFPETFTVGIFKRDRGEWERLEWAELPESVSIQPSGTANRLRAECVEDRLSLFLNGQRVLTAYDGDFRTGGVGFIASGSGSKREPVEVTFDNLQVFSTEQQ